MCQSIFGRFCHWGPLIAFAIISWVTLSTVYCNLMWWPPAATTSGMANMIGFLCLSCLTSYHFFASMGEGPGFVEYGWEPKKKADREFLQFCDTCQGYKVPRSHHCRKCNRCVKKMDHHCPWINTCVGHQNHGHFIGFLFTAVIGCFHATIVQTMTIYYGLHRSYYYIHGTGNEPFVTLTLFTLLTTLLGLGLSIGVVLAVGVLLFFQVRSVLRNQTGIEDWIIEKANYRLRNKPQKFENPYNLGRWKNFFEVIRPGCDARGDGIIWPLKDGAQEYDLTIEQKLQKHEKRHRTREYKIIQPFSGSWLPFWSMGFGVTCHPPCTDEPRIPLSEGDIVRVTRWKKHWLYGDKVLSGVGSGEHRVRGWFPRKCAVDITCHESDQGSQAINGSSSKKDK